MVVVGGMAEVPKAFGIPGTSNFQPIRCASPYRSSLQNNKNKNKNENNKNSKHKKMNQNAIIKGC